MDYFYSPFKLMEDKGGHFPPSLHPADFSLFPFPHQEDWSQDITLHVTVPGGGVVGISEGAGVSSVGVSFAGGLGSETAAVAAGVSFGGAAPKLTEKWKKKKHFVNNSQLHSLTPTIN